ncbi:PH domain-containing protein [Shewanella sp. SG44-6]|uniref:PH domain-containing protein n=1 Tax=Shewanella sp. SG44-6 TaxID=2760959 RepID=UPI001602B83C|nr:PH domain-containing protein [Shewanella sp. SG44-6]MBB1388666.1 PH domain-containing protein [Shewanella sp. SG44-6]
MDTPPHVKSPFEQPPINEPAIISDTAILSAEKLSAEKESSTNIYDHGRRLSQADYIQLADLPLSNIDANYPKLLLIISTLIAVVTLSLLSVFQLIAQPLPLMIALLGLVSATLLAAIIIKLIHLKASKIAYGLFKHEMVLREGLFWISTTALPYTRLQHVNLSQGPLERKYNLVTLKCFSAGSGLAEIDLPGINADLAEHLRQHLLSQAAASHPSDIAEDDMVETRAPNQETDTLSIYPAQQDNHNE